MRSLLVRAAGVLYTFDHSTKRLSKVDGEARDTRFLRVVRAGNNLEPVEDNEMLPSEPLRCLDVRFSHGLS
jgi:hypothetical protein